MQVASVSLLNSTSALHMLPRKTIYFLLKIIPGKLVQLERSFTHPALLPVPFFRLFQERTLIKGISKVQIGVELVQLDQVLVASWHLSQFIYPLSHCGHPIFAHFPYPQSLHALDESSRKIHKEGASLAQNSLYHVGIS